MTPHRFRRASAIVVLALVVAGLGLGACRSQKTPAESLALARKEHDAGNNQAAFIELKNALQQDAGNLEARRLLADLYLESGQGVEAEIELNRLVNGGVDARVIRAPLGRSLLQQGNYNRVIAEIRPEADMDPTQNSEVAEIRGEAFFALGQKADAAKEFAQALVDQPGYPEALIGQAQIALSNVNYEGASRLTEQVLATAPDNLRALLLKADIQRFLNKPDEAQNIYQAILAKHPTNAIALSNSAYLRIVAGQYDEAAKSIAAIRAFGNGAASANYLQALIDFRKKNYVPARDAIQKALAVAPTHLPSIMLAGTIEYSLGAYEQSERLMRQVVSSSPNTVYARQVLAMALMKQGRGADAAEVLEPVGRGIQDPKLLALLGEAFLTSRQYGKAAEYFARATAADPQDVGGRLRLGASRLAIGQTDRAMQDFQEAVQLEPTESSADFVLILTLMRQRDYDQALKAVAALEQRQPENPLMWNLKGGALLAKKDTANARIAFEKALAVQPLFVPAAMNLAALDLQAKNPDAAKARFDRMIAKDPNNGEALVAYATLLRDLGSPGKDVVALLEKARAANPKAVEPRLLLVQGLVASDPKRAATVAKELLALDPQNPAVLDAVGMSQLASGEQGAALATYGKLVELQPQSAAAHVRLAELYMQNSNEGAAARELRTALGINPGHRDAQLLLVGIEGRSGRTTEALKVAQQIQKDSPKLAMGWILEGDVWMSAKKPAQAAAAYDHAFEIAKSTPLMLKIHSASTAAGKSAEANARLMRWMADHPDEVEARIYYANSLLRGSQYRAAIEQYQLVVEKDPKQVVALNDLAWLYGQVADPRALPTAERAYAVQPENVQVADTFGTLLIDSGQVQKGVDVLRKAVDAVPTFHAARLHLARGYQKLGDRIKARQEFESVSNSSNNPAQRTEAATALKDLDR